MRDKKQNWAEGEVELWCRYNKVLANPLGSSGALESIGVAPQWAEVTVITSPLSVARYGPPKGMLLGGTLLCSWHRRWRCWQLEAVWWPLSPKPGRSLLEGRYRWYMAMSSRIAGTLIHQRLTCYYIWFLPFTLYPLTHSHAHNIYLLNFRWIIGKTYLLNHLQTSWNFIPDALSACPKNKDVL